MISRLFEEEFKMKFTPFANMCRILRLTVRPKNVGLALLTTFLFFAGDGRAASPGALDLSFGIRGTAALNLGNVFQETRAIAIQPDGKIVIAGFINTCVGPTCNFNFLIVRFNTDGTLDNTFGTNGSVVTDYSGQDESAFAVDVQTDGRIVVAGGSLSGGPILGFKVVRYLQNGTLDSSFGVGGKVYESFDDLGGIPQTMLIQPDGKIVVAGTDNNSMLFVARFNLDGGLDTGFATNGRIASSAYNVFVARLARQSDGKLIIAASGLPGGTLKLIRFNTNGTSDGGFGVGGVTTSVFSGAFEPTVGVQSDNKILVSGAYYNGDLRIPPLRRFNDDGSLDAGFVPNHGEIVGGACISCTQKPSKILVLPDNRFYLVGYNARNDSSRKIMASSRYLTNGSLDPSFGFRGASQFRHSNSHDYLNNSLGSVRDAALQSDGKVVVAATGQLPISNFGQNHLLAIRLASAVTPPAVRGDFDGDGKTDFAVFRPASRFWYVLRSFDNSYSQERYGAVGDIPLPSDYNYDLKTDLSVYRPTENSWYISTSLPSGGGVAGGLFGLSGDINVPEDYDGDGYADIAVFRPSNGTWNIRYSSLSYDFQSLPYEVSFPWGSASDKPVPGDYDGDGRADLAVFRPSNGYWYILRSSDGQMTAVNFGLGTDKTVQGDYDGDLKTDIAIYRDGGWYVLRSSDNSVTGVSWGLSTDKPVPGDYDGDGKFDVAVFRPPTGAWYAIKSSDSSFIGQAWGESEDVPIPFTFVR